MKIIQIQQPEVGKVVPLFDAYRQFYEQPSNIGMARRYLSERIEGKDCVLFAAQSDGDECFGFTLLYPTFCSVAAQKAWILYDLFVDPSQRRKGIAQKLLAAAQQFGANSGAAWLRLETAKTNVAGNRLYEKMGWQQETAFHTYFFSPHPAQKATS